MSVIKKLTPEILKKMIDEEKQQINLSEKASSPKSKSKAEIVDAPDLADTLAKKVDYAKKLSVHEARLTRQLREVLKTKIALKKLILKEL
tara:strand:+ start:377 stop:646 length:270 start_codon:yes stop_codon:yes gene_type:complete